MLALLSIVSLVLKKFAPNEKRTWRIFLLDIGKQLITAAFGHCLNLVFAELLQQVTKSGNGCVWYLMNILTDVAFGTFLSFLLFKLVDYIAMKNKIDVLKQGMYYDENLDLTKE